LPCRDTHVDSADDFNYEATGIRDQVPVVIPEDRRIMPGLLQQRKVLAFNDLGVDSLTPVSLVIALQYALVDSAERFDQILHSDPAFASKQRSCTGRMKHACAFHAGSCSIVCGIAFPARNPTLD
jgi:hypothetical protein